MPSKNSRLDRYLSKKLAIKRGDIRLLIAQKRIMVDGVAALDCSQSIGPFNLIAFDNQILQRQTAHYIMLHKPIGVVSATLDTHHTTLLDLIDRRQYPNLHIAGRLDLNTSGLVILTNDGKFSRGLSEPTSEIKKKYLVELEHPINDEYISAFAQGMYFHYEDITTKPALLRIIGEHVAEVELTEGRYHQIKRMFGRFRNPVKSLHRMAIGKLALCQALQPGQYRPLNEHELSILWQQINRSD